MTIPSINPSEHRFKYCFASRQRKLTEEGRLGESPSPAPTPLVNVDSVSGLPAPRESALSPAITPELAPGQHGAPDRSGGPSPGDNISDFLRSQVPAVAPTGELTASATAEYALYVFQFYSMNRFLEGKR